MSREELNLIGHDSDKETATNFGMRRVVVAPLPDERCFLQSDHKIEGTVDSNMEFSTYQAEPADHLKETFIDFSGQYLQDDYPSASVSFEQCNLVSEFHNEALELFDQSSYVKFGTGFFSFLVTILCLGSLIFCC